MANPSGSDPVLDEELAAFIQRGEISIHAASRNAALESNLSRALGCRVAPGRRRVTIFLLASQSGAILADFRANGAIAAVFSQPSTHRTVQLKGTDAAVEAVEEGDAARIARHREAFASELASIGFPEALPRALLAGARADVVAVGFTPLEAFQQTPGPTAGTPIRSRR